MVGACSSTTCAQFFVSRFMITYCLHFPVMHGSWIFVIAFDDYLFFNYHLRPVKGFRLKQFGSCKWLFLILIMHTCSLRQFFSIWLRDKKRNVVQSTFNIWCSIYLFNFGRLCNFTYRVAPI